MVVDSNELLLEKALVEVIVSMVFIGKGILIANIRSDEVTITGLDIV